MKELIENATIEDAREWASTPEKWAFCVDYLGISAERRDSTKLVDALEERLEALLDDARKGS